MIEPTILQDRRDTLIELQRRTLDLILLLTSVSVWMGLLLGDVYARSVTTEVIAFGVGVELVCGICFWLRGSHFRLAAHFLVAGLWVCNGLAAYHFTDPLFLFLFPFISIVAGALLHAATACVMTLATSAFMLLLMAVSLPSQVILPPLYLTWFSLGIMLSVQGGLYQALGIAWSYQDYATEQMRDAREHRGQLMKLTKALQEATHDLQRANTQLRHAQNVAEEARRLKAQFAANVSHELRTPINLIVGFSEMMIMAPEAYGELLPSAYRADLHAIYRNGKHLQGLINDVLDISQIEAGRMIVMKERADPRQVILEAVELARDLVKSRGLALNVLVPETLPPVSIDRLRVRQVILNLLSNATRFTDQGSITLRVEVDEACLQISVADTGIGIRAEDLGRVFEEFNQLDGSLSRRQGGTGLGLALSKHFVKLHGGRMWVESEGIPGKGSTFYFTLPLDTHATAQRSLVTAAPAAPDGDARHLVVLDEDPAILQLFERYTDKHHVASARDFDEASRLVERIHPTALVVDRKHFEAQGEPVIRKLSDKTPVICCPMPSGRRVVQSLGVADYLVKPVSRRALLDALERLRRPIRTVLVVDDDRDVVRMFSRMLRAAPQAYDVIQAYSGEEGLAQMRKHPPDAVVLDLLMPDVDGFAVIEHMKADPSLADVAIVLISARGAVDTIAPSAEGELTVSKPAGFQPVELVRCVEALVDALTPASVSAHSENPLDRGVSSQNRRPLGSVDN